MNKSESYRINSSKVVSETIDGEVVIVNLQKGNYYSVAKSGAQIWSGVERGLSHNEILEEIIEKYDDTQEKITKAVNGFIDILKNEELILVEPVNGKASAKGANEQESAKSNTEKLSFDLPTLEKYTDMEDLLLLDPIHEVDDETGWPNVKQEQV